MTFFDGDKIMPGNENFSACIQKPILHAIFREFIMNMKSDPNGNAMGNLLLAVDELHSSMQYPFGRIEMARKNLYKDTEQTTFYCIRELIILPNIIEDEDYVIKALILDKEFCQDWANARTSIKTLIDEIKVYALNPALPISSGTLNRYIRVKGLATLLEKSKLSLMKLRQAWQLLWHSYLGIAETLRHNGKRLLK